MVKTTWCGFCRQMDRSTLIDASVVDFVGKHFVACRIDAEEGEGIAFAAKHKVKAYPEILLFYPDGKLLGKIKGYKEADEFLYYLNDFQEKFAKKKSKE